MITIKNLTHRFENLKALNNVSLNIDESRVAIMGANGSGKTTLVKHINGLLLPNSGSVSVDGVSASHSSIKRKVGFVFQNADDQIVYPTVQEDVEFGLKNLKVSDVKKKSDSILKFVGLENYKNHASHLLSAGQKQLLTIAGVLVMEPEYVIFDEPTTMLDYKNKEKILKLIKKLKQKVVYVSHDASEIMGFDRLIVLENGKVVLDGKPKKVIKRYLK